MADAGFTGSLVLVLPDQPPSIELLKNSVILPKGLLCN
jgi:hypothetical protein